MPKLVWIGRMGRMVALIPLHVVVHQRVAIVAIDRQHDDAQEKQVGHGEHGLHALRAPGDHHRADDEPDGATRHEHFAAGPRDGGRHEELAFLVLRQEERVDAEGDGIVEHSDDRSDEGRQWLHRHDESDDKELRKS